MVAAASAASAQTGGDGAPDPSKVRVRIGPLWMNPTIALTNLGVDTNVFNGPAGQEQKDFTATVTPMKVFDRARISALPEYACSWRLERASISNPGRSRVLTHMVDVANLSRLSGTFQPSL